MSSKFEGFLVSTIELFLSSFSSIYTTYKCIPFWHRNVWECTGVKSKKKALGIIGVIISRHDHFSQCDIHIPWTYVYNATSLRSLLIIFQKYQFIEVRIRISFILHNFFFLRLTRVSRILVMKKLEKYRGKIQIMQFKISMIQLPTVTL